MPTLDTNVVLRWLLDDIAEQTAAADALIASGAECVVPDVVVIETVYVLEKVMSLTRETVIAAIETIFVVSNARLDRTLWRQALDDYAAYPKLSISDTYLGALARDTRQLPLFTFDQKLASQVEGAALLV
ncbi:MAG TPA: PIN domain-containing protein [Terrimesophilobacter sp.]|nr:PIN domain-containing protein [Terrimesophilobacter sp.]HRQ00926.1 PIN domain-containing protein [Terrimesophilobacter sp.]